jgi:hypothetical protein
MSRKYELLEAALSAVVIVVAAMVHSLLVVIALAGAVMLATLVHVGLAWRRDRALCAQLEKELQETPWALVPGAGGAG